MAAEFFIAIGFCHQPQFNSKFIKVNGSEKFNKLIKHNYFIHSLERVLQDTVYLLKRRSVQAALVHCKTWLALKISNWKKNLFSF